MNVKKKKIQNCPRIVIEIVTLPTPWRGLRTSGPGGHFEKQLLKNISQIVKLASCMKRLTPKWAITEFQRYVNQAKTLKSFQNRKSGHMEPGSWIRMLLDFSAALEFRKQQIVFQILREDHFQPRILYPLTWSAKCERRPSWNRKSFRKFPACCPYSDSYWMS